MISALGFFKRNAVAAFNCSSAWFVSPVESVLKYISTLCLKEIGDGRIWVELALGFTAWLEAVLESWVSIFFLFNDTVSDRRGSVPIPSLSPGDSTASILFCSGSFAGSGFCATLGTSSAEIFGLRISASCCACAATMRHRLSKPGP